MFEVKFRQHNTEGVRYYSCSKINYSRDSDCIVLIHGEGCDHAFWGKIPEGLVHMGFSPVCIDLPQHGKSREGLFTQSLPTYADAVIKVIKKLRCSKISLVGHSMGGIIALLVEKEMREKEKIANLLLISSNIYSPSHMYLNTYLSRYPSKAFEYLLKHGFAPRNRRKGKEFLKKIFEQENLKIFQRDVALMENTSLLNVLSKTKTPMVVLSGEKDGITPPEDVDAMIGNLPNATHIIIPSVGHYLPIERPSLLIAQIADAFLPSYSHFHPVII